MVGVFSVAHLIGGKHIFLDMYKYKNLALMSIKMDEMQLL